MLKHRHNARQSRDHETVDSETHAECDQNEAPALNRPNYIFALTNWSRDKGRGSGSSRMMSTSCDQVKSLQRDQAEPDERVKAIIQAEVETRQQLIVQPSGNGGQYDDTLSDICNLQGIRSPRHVADQIKDRWGCPAPCRALPRTLVFLALARQFAG